MNPLEFRLLGSPEIRVNGAPVTGMPAKLEALLLHLAAEPRAHSRSRLAALLWGDRSEADARTNLRAALQKVPPSLAPHLQVAREWIAIQPAGPLTVDLREVERALEEEAIPLERLREAGRRCRGEFLEGFAVAKAAEFESWCGAERERARDLAARLFAKLGTREREAGRLGEAASAWRRLLALSPGHDGALRELMGTLAESGDRPGALETFERYRKAWREELGVAPSPATLRQAERLAAGDEDAAETAPAPARVTLLGRDRECALVSQWLADEAVPLVTLAGPGGIGKSRLAQAVLEREAGRFADGGYFIAVGGLRSGAGLGSALAQALRLELRGAVAAMDQLAEHLRDRQALLVLDGFEQVLAGDRARAGGPDAVSQLLALAEAAPGVRLLLASRESLGVGAERVLALGGLDYPPEDDESPGWAERPAVRLFVARAARAYPQFSAERERAGILRICRLVDGMPLALELAAALTRTAPCAEIAREIERDASRLASEDDPALSPRHRRLDVAVACAWNQLDAAHQACAASLSFIRGTLTSESAEAVAGASLRQLSALVDRSWLRRLPEGGYAMHDVLRQFAAKRRREHAIEEARLADAHARHFTGWIARQRESLRRGDIAPAVASVHRHWADLVIAAEHAVATPSLGDVDAPLETLYEYLATRGDFPGGIDLFAALGKLARRPRATERRRLRARIDGCHGWCQAQLARYDEAIATLEAALADARAAGHLEAEAFILRGLVVAGALGGRGEAVEPVLAACLAATHALGDPYGEVATLLAQGVAANYIGESVGHTEANERALEICRRLDYRRGILVAGFNLGLAYRANGRDAEARETLGESLRLARALRNDRVAAMSAVNLASMAEMAGDLDGAAAWLAEGEPIARRAGDRRLFAAFAQGSAEVAIARARLDEAAAWIARQREAADGIGWRWSSAFADALGAQVACLRGDRVGTLAAVRDLIASPTTRDFPIHAASAALEALRIVLAFDDAPDAQASARGALQHVADHHPDDWLRRRARRALETHAGAAVPWTEGSDLLAHAQALVPELAPGVPAR